MRAKTLAIFVVAAACVVATVAYLFPGLFQQAEQVVWPRQPAAADASSGSKRSGGDAGRAASVISATATTADFPIRRYAVGFISSPAVVDVSARVSSQVVAVAVKDGQMVKAGDLLFSLDDRALTAQVERDKATLQKDQAQLASAEADLSRAKDLVAKQAGTQQAYDQALAAEKGDQATLAADQAALDADQVQLSFTRITAPISGRLGAINVTVGDLVSTGSGNSTAAPMVTITQMDPLQVGFNLPESDLPLLRQALAAPRNSSVTLRKDGDPKPLGSGTLDFVDSSVDTASGTIAARATVSNRDQALWPGQYVDIVLDAGTMPKMVSVPTVAVQPSQKGPFVYVVKQDSTVEARQVQVALTVGDNSAIGDGLKSGERVVVEGQTRLKDGAPVRAAKAAQGDGAEAAPKVADGAGGQRP